VVPGHRVASGQGGDPRFPSGTIDLQLPFLRAGIPDLTDWLGGEPFAGTLNLRMAGPVTIRRPEIMLPHVRWTAALPAETFFLSKATLAVGGRRHAVWLYMPDPATKPDHFQPADRVELLGRAMAGVAYGTSVGLAYDPAAIGIG